MCIFYEKVNVQEGLIRDGNIEMQALEEETRCLQMITKEEGRQTALSRKLLPCQRRLKGESTMLQIQLSECKERMLELEKALEDPGQENRARELEGNDPSPVELIQKIEQVKLEVGLAEREELLLEKDLVFEQVTRLSQRIRAKAENGKQDTLQLAKKVNELQGRIKESTRRMMAVVSELSMRQASAMTLQQELKERELFLDTCHRRLDQGLPPSEDLEQEWQHILRDEQRRQADQQEKDREFINRSQLPSGVYTTAEARPNAYIPLGDTLPLPKPYGALAPFKPSEPGTNIRHIRKPEPKPIEI
uniref:Coiled-coil domain-containing protein 146 n=1 Tax=Oncorhynchus mykiss TaxID=8022 RepID=A0A8C7PN85_ONCMY